MDRFNAVLELDQRPHDVSATMYREAIERQASSLIRKLPRRSPFSWFATSVHVAIAALLLLVTVCFYAHFEPLQLLANKATVAEPGESSDVPLAIPEIPADDPAVSALADDEATEPWGEIRISEPGRDLRVTRHEDIPLLIEAAADRPLVDVFWSTAINIGDETRNALPEFEDPRYAVFQPMLKPDDLGLGAWDLVHYRAVAIAEDDTEYESTTYFVQIIPSRDELDQLPKAAYEQLEEMTELIQQQQEVIRQTDRLEDTGDPPQARRMEALAEQENRIASSTESLQVALQNRLPSHVPEPFVSSIESAREALQEAESALGEHNSSAARDPEQSALMRLADARRQLANLVREHPEAFEPSTLTAIDEERARGATPADPELAKLLEKLGREARETATAAGQLEALVAEQQQLAENVRRQPVDDLPPLAATQRDVQQRLEKIRETKPSAFRDLTTLSAQADAALERAADRLDQASSAATTATEQAQQSLQQLAGEMTRRQLANEVAQADALQHRLDANRQAYREIQDQPKQIESSDLKQTTNETRNLLEQLQQLAANGSSQDRNPELAKQLSPEVADQIARQCDAIGQTATAAERSTMAEGIAKSLEQLSDALAKDLTEQGSGLDQQQVASSLEQMQQRIDGLRSARESVQQALLQQRSIQRNAYTDRGQKKNYPSLAERQLALEQQLQQTMDQNSNAFERAANECQSARSAMRQTAQSLSSKGENAAQLADDAAQQLQQLDDALEKQQQHSGISDHQLVREMLERLNKRLEKIAKQPNEATSQQKQRTAGQCKSVGSKACQMAGQNAGGSSGSVGQSGSGQSQSPSASTSSGRPPMEQPGESGQPAAGAGSRQQQIEDASNRLASAQGDQETASAARNLQQQLQGLAAALDAQQPGGKQRGGQTGQANSGSSGRRDTLRPTGSEAIDRGLAQLETAARRGQQGALTAGASQALQRGGIADVVAGIDSQYGYNENTRAVVRRLNEQLDDPTSPVDLKTLQSLREQIQSLQQDLTIQAESPVEVGPTSHVDPSRFPPDYRDAIQKYFQALSEHP